MRHPAFGGFRADLGKYFRSVWEANYARYLNHLMRQSGADIVVWDYEAEEFEFPVKRGTRFYKPDFRVRFRDGRTEYHEVKGWMDQKSATALDRMARYHPEVKIVLIERGFFGDLKSKGLHLEISGWERIA